MNRTIHHHLANNHPHTHPPAMSSRNSATILLVSACTATTLFFVGSHFVYRKLRSRWQEIEERTYGEGLHSIIRHFRSLTLDQDTTIGEANKRRTVCYYERSREAHSCKLVLGVNSHSKLIQLRQRQIEASLSNYHRGDQSHRTIIVMCDSYTATLLKEAREKILRPLNYATDIQTPSVWIPEMYRIPQQDMHVTVAIPWWWHTMREGNRELSHELASRFRQTLLLKFHYPFQIELERIVLLGGSTLVALWRCVGERTTPEGSVIYDRHGETVDPFLRLRQEIVRCFTTESPDGRRQPLTYVHRHAEPRKRLVRQNSIEKKTPGMGNGDGFIHTTLCRLPLNCLSQSDVDLGAVHRLCREATATLCGHRMVVSSFRFIETMGHGGEVRHFWCCSSLSLPFIP